MGCEWCVDMAADFVCEREHAEAFQSQRGVCLVVPPGLATAAAAQQRSDRLGRAFDKTEHRVALGKGNLRGAVSEVAGESHGGHALERGGEVWLVGGLRSAEKGMGGGGLAALFDQAEYRLGSCGREPRRTCAVEVWWRKCTGQQGLPVSVAVLLSEAEHGGALGGGRASEVSREGDGGHAVERRGGWRVGGECVRCRVLRVHV